MANKITLFGQYVSKDVIEKAEKKRILNTYREWDGQKAIYIVEGTTGSNAHTVVIEKMDNEVSVFCSCIAYITGKICSHILLAFNHIAEKDKTTIPLFEAWMKKKKEEEENEC
jgi:hypothetical protein